jgi:hypothetical protein
MEHSAGGGVLESRHLGEDLGGHEAHAIARLRGREERLSGAHRDDEVMRRKVRRGPGVDLRRELEVEARIANLDRGDDALNGVA